MFSRVWRQPQQAAEEPDQEDADDEEPVLISQRQRAESSNDLASVAENGVGSSGGTDHSLVQRIRELEKRLSETEDELEFYYKWYKANKARVDRLKTEESLKEEAAAAAGSKGALGFARGFRSGGSDIGGRGQGDDDVDDDDDNGPEREQRDTLEPWSRTLGRNTALEYTRDSPMFRHQMRAFAGSLAPLKAHTEGLLRLVHEYCKAGQKLRERGVALAEAMCAKEAGRMLFTNSYPDMGSLAQNLFAFSANFRQIQELLNILMCTLESGLAGPLQAFADRFRDLNGLEAGLEARREAFEAQLGKALDLRELPTSGKYYDEIMAARRDYELYRFDMVKYLNQLDARKKIACLEPGINNAYYAMLAFFQGGLDSVRTHEAHMRRRQARLDDVQRQYAEDDAVWCGVRARLDAELMGALPPPGAPLGALAPMGPRGGGGGGGGPFGYGGYGAGPPPYATGLTTEVLSQHSQSASAKDLEHARDEGALVKQGWLVSRRALFRRERRWYRLHGGKLYTVDDDPDRGPLGGSGGGFGGGGYGGGGTGGGAGSGLELTCVFDLKDCTMVTSKPGRYPFSFIVVSEDGLGLELQAEGADEAVRWMAALRRGLRAAGGGRDAPPQREVSGLSAEVLRLRFEAENAACGECGDAGVEWASANIGVALCSACAAIHRTLGVNVSALRSLHLDKWSVFVLRAMVEHMGNSRMCHVWENNVSAGWTKPTPASAASEREHFILAKYQWFGFVEESPLGVEDVSQRLLRAAGAGDVEQVVWCTAHKGDVHYRGEGGRTPLHAACAAAAASAATVLLLNGADINRPDDTGRTPADLVVEGGDADMALLLWEVERGELW